MGILVDESHWFTLALSVACAFVFTGCRLRTLNKHSSMAAKPNQDQNAAVSGALARLEELARQNGQAVGFARGYPISIDRIAGWALSLRDRGIDLVPLTGTITQSEGEKPESG